MKKTWATIVLATILVTLLGGCVTTSPQSGGGAREESPFPK
jgi:hypothetical protein